VLAAQRGLAERAGTHSVFSDVAIQCVGQHISEPIPQDRKLWQAFAGRIDFDSRASIMLENAQQRLTRWLAEFQQQYLAWKARADVIAKARAYELGDSASGPYGDPWTILGDVVGVGTPADPFFDMAQRDIPLTILFTN
jgi:hypothetical protein